MGFDLFLWNRLENKIVNGKVLKMLYQNIVNILPFGTDYAPVLISAFSELDNSNHLIYHLIILSFGFMRLPAIPLQNII